jgi:hypothetical protein
MSESKKASNSFGRCSSSTTAGGPRPHPFPGDWINLFLSSIVEIRQHRDLVFSSCGTSFAALQSRIDHFTVRGILEHVPKKLIDFFD